MFEKDVLQSNGKNSIQINITGVGSANVVGSSNEVCDTESTDIIDGEYTDAES
jgi:hypothetical protein